MYICTYDSLPFIVIYLCSYRIKPRLLRNVKDVKIETTLLGSPVATPIGISPTGRHREFWHDGEISTAKDSCVEFILCFMHI